MTRVNRMEPLGEALRHELAGWRFDESMRTRVRAALAAEVQAHPSAAVRTGARGRGLERKPSVWWWTGGGLAVAALALFWSARAIGPGVEERSLSRAGSAAPAAQVAAPAPAVPAGGGAGVMAAKENGGEAATALVAGASAAQQPAEGVARPHAAADASIANARPERDLTTRTAAPSRARTTPDELARSAAVIAQVRVRAAANGEISVVVERPFKGTASGAELRLLWPAGPTPAPAPETRLFLFAEPLPDRPGLWRPVSDAQGVYRISADGTQAATDDDPATPVPVEQLIQAAG